MAVSVAAADIGAWSAPGSVLAARRPRGRRHNAWERLSRNRAALAGLGLIALRHLLPSILAPVIVSTAFAVPNAIMAEAGLSFLGLGIRPPTASWGSMLQAGLPDIYGTPSLVVAPSLCIALVMLAFTFLGDGLRDALDPRLQ